MGPLFESPPRLLLKSNLQPLARNGTHQETISRRSEQMYTLIPPSGTRLDRNGLRRGYYLSRTRMNAQGGIIEVMLGALS